MVWVPRLLNGDLLLSDPNYDLLRCVCQRGGELAMRRTTVRFQSLSLSSPRYAIKNNIRKLLANVNEASSLTRALAYCADCRRDIM